MAIFPFNLTLVLFLYLFLSCSIPLHFTCTTTPSSAPVRYSPRVFIHLSISYKLVFFSLSGEMVWMFAFYIFSFCIWDGTACVVVLCFYNAICHSQGTNQCVYDRCCWYNPSIRLFIMKRSHESANQGTPDTSKKQRTTSPYRLVTRKNLIWWWIVLILI